MHSNFISQSRNNVQRRNSALANAGSNIISDQPTEPLTETQFNNIKLKMQQEYDILFSRYSSLHKNVYHQRQNFLTEIQELKIKKNKLENRVSILEEENQELRRKLAAYIPSPARPSTPNKTELHPTNNPSFFRPRLRPSLLQQKQDQERERLGQCGLLEPFSLG